MDSSLLQEEFDNTVGVDIDGDFKVDEQIEEFVVKTVE